MTLGAADAAGWVLALLVLAGVAAAAGEGVRVGLARWLEWFRVVEPVERFVLDLYLGGAALYVVALLPLGLFRPVVVVGLWSLAIVVGGLAAVHRWDTGSAVRRLAGTLRRLARPAELAALASAALVLCVEIVATAGVLTGNTFDSSVDATFTALLAAHGNLALTLQPVSRDLIAYPQGSTVWFAVGQLLVGWPTAELPLRVTPLFMALAPLAGFALGRRWLGTDRAGAVFAVGMAVLVPGTRYVAYGSNDFVLAFPLVLLLAARASEWCGPIPPSGRDALAFGLVTGYSAALNPVGAEWLLTSLAIVGLLGLGFSRGDTARWARSWFVAAITSVLGVVPSVLALAAGTTATGSGGSGVGPGGITGAQFVGWTDPFVFGPGHPVLNPDTLVQVELAALLAVGAAVLVLQATTRSSRHRPFRTWIAAAVGAGLVWEAVALAGGNGQGWAAAVSAVSSGGELALLLFTVYGLVALYPLCRWLDVASEGRGDAAAVPDRHRARAPTPEVSRPVVLGVALLVLLPGTVATVALLPEENGSLYHDFSQVTADELALLAYVGRELPHGARVLVAPGSAAEFLPAYNPTVTLLFPMTGASWRSNATYVQLCGLLVNGTFGKASGNAGMRDLAALGVQYVLVTGNDTTLFPPFDGAAMRASGDFSVLYGTPAGTFFAYDAPVPYPAAPG